MDFVKSVDGVCEMKFFQPAGEPRGWVLVEVPHGATRKSDFDTVAARMKSRLPAQLEHFFFVNTDIGAPEGAEFLGETLRAQGLAVVTVRCLIPRTFIDTNRVIANVKKGVAVAGLTAGVPSYIDHPDDVEWLSGLHAEYHRLVKDAYANVCEVEGGIAVQLHSYAPRSVGIEKTDEKIVEALHAAYVPEVYAKWPERPAIDLICATEDGSFRLAPKLVDALQAAYVEAGIDAKQNGTYHLHPVTMGMVYARAFPRQVLCVELNRGRVADPFTPFGVSPISAAKVETMCRPIAKVLAAELLGSTVARN